MLTLALALLATSQATPEVVATATLTVQPTGPRAGTTGTAFLNVEGKENGKYASFGLLTFPAPRPGAGRAEALELTFAQSVARFSKDGRIKFFLVDSPPADPKALQFVAESPGGLGGQFEKRTPLGSGSFQKAETGHVDTFTLALDDAARKALEARLASGGDVHLLIVPEDDVVAATYFGATAEDAGRRPKLVLKRSAP